MYDDFMMFSHFYHICEIFSTFFTRNLFLNCNIRVENLCFIFCEAFVDKKHEMKWKIKKYTDVENNTEFVGVAVGIFLFLLHFLHRDNKV